jgi:membrane protease YdiL (CAAX protease family)
VLYIRINRPVNILAFLAEIIGFTLLLQAVSSPVWPLASNSIAGALAAWLLYGLAAGLLGWVFNHILRGQGFGELGFRYHKSFWTDVWLGLLGYGVLCIFSLPLDLAALSDRAKMFGQMLGPSRSSIFQTVLFGSALAIILGFITGAFNEEIRFRGYYQGIGARELSPLAGFIIGFLPFSFGHYFAHPDWSLVQVLATVLPGIVFGFLYNATGSLIVVMTAHMLANWIGSYPALIYAVTKNRVAGVAVAAVLWLLFLVLIVSRRNREMRAWLELTRTMFREQLGFGLVAGFLVGFALLAVWPLRITPIYAGVLGLLLFCVAFLGKWIATRASVQRGSLHPQP